MRAPILRIQLGCPPPFDLSIGSTNSLQFCSLRESNEYTHFPVVWLSEVASVCNHLASLILLWEVWAPQDGSTLLFSRLLRPTIPALLYALNLKS